MGEIQKTGDSLKSVQAFLEAQEKAIQRRLPAKLRHNVRKVQAGFYECATADTEILNAVVNYPAIARGGLLTAATMGWTLGTTMQADAHMLAFWSGKHKGKIPTLVPNYHGLKRLAYQHPKVLDINEGAVFSEDFFEYELGSDPYARHRKAEGKRGEFTHAWVVILLAGGGKIVEVLTKHEVDEIREESPGKNSPAWRDYYPRQAEKTALKRALKRAPRTEELAFAMEIDGQADAGIEQTLHHVPDAEVYDAEVEDDGSAPQQQQEEAPPAQERPAARRGSAASEKQTKCIFAISNALGLTDAQRKAVMVEIAGVDSSKDLTSQQAKAVIDCLKNAQDGNSAQLDNILGEAS